MKNPEKWKPTKYEMLNGQLRGSRNPSELAISSRYIADMTARFYNRAIPLHSKGKIVDLGCGKAPMYQLYKDYSTDITLTDWPQSAHENECLDLSCDLNTALPFKDNYFDTILLSDVLEHISEPLLLWKEMYRILSPKGKVLLNVPFFYWIHEHPHDYHRYTEYSLRYMAKVAGFSVLELDCFGGVPLIVLDLLGKSMIKKKPLGKYAASFIQKLSNTLKNYSLKNNKRKLFPIAYFMVVEKE